MNTRTGIDVVSVPYDSGRRGWRMGAGPLRLIERGLLDRLRDLGHDVSLVEIELADGARAAAGAEGEAAPAAYDLAARIGEAVRAARDAHRFPLVLSGNCNSALGTVAGLGAGTTGVVWFDAHGDYNTPDTSESGFLDGMSLATLTGRCCTAETARIPGFARVAEEAVALVGARDLDPAERRALDGSGIRVVPPGAGTSEQLAGAIEGWPAAVSQAYVHVDLDVLDADEARVNDYAAAGGLTVSGLLLCIDAVAAHAPIAAAAITALDPDADADGRALAAAIAVIEEIVTRADPTDVMSQR